MNNEEEGNSLEPEDIPSAGIGSKLETTKVLEVGLTESRLRQRDKGTVSRSSKLLSFEVSGDMIPGKTESRRDFWIEKWRPLLRKPATWKDIRHYTDM
jgi:hypothetical protein